MFEELFSLAILSELHLIHKSKYLDRLNFYFDNFSNNDLLLELEFLFEDINSAVNKIVNFTYDTFDFQQFGIILFNELEISYYSNQYSIAEFASKMYLLWNLYLSESIQLEEPFWTLSYADDCLAYGDEKQTRALYEKTFQYYK